MREPRRAAERRRLDEGRRHVAAGRLRCCGELAPAVRDDRGDRRRIVGHGAVRLEEDQQHVGAANTAEVRRRERPIGQSPARGVRARLEHERELIAISREHGRREPITDGLEGVPQEEGRDEHRRERAERAARPRVAQTPLDARERPVQRAADHRDERGQPREKRDEHPWLSDLGQHRADVR